MIEAFGLMSVLHGEALNTHRGVHVVVTVASLDSIPNVLLRLQA